MTDLSDLEAKARAATPGAMTAPTPEERAASLPLGNCLEPTYAAHMHAKSIIAEAIRAAEAIARAEGRREGLEAAWSAAWDAYDLNNNDAHDTYLNIERAIRALAKVSP